MIKSRPIKELNPTSFRKMILSKIIDLALLSRYAQGADVRQNILQRPFLMRVLGEASKLEEVLDAYGAKNNREWAKLRSLTAAVKAFANQSYVVLHLICAIPRYRLLPIEGDFLEASNSSAQILGEILQRVLVAFDQEVVRHGFEILGYFGQRSSLVETTLSGFLPADHEKKHIDAPGRIVVNIASSFLAESGQTFLRTISGKIDRNSYTDLVPNLINERVLRMTEQGFHNLQSLYDTYISETDLEIQDPDLPVIRGHVSAIYHLFELATLVSHHYERHLAPPRADHGSTRLVEPETLFKILIDYAVKYACRFVKAGQELCQTVIKRYAEPARVKVPVPVYRGFHVRPSTLIAKIVLHYGSEVWLETPDGSRYDASSPLELFRVNEKINAEKRRVLTQFVNLMPELSREAKGVEEMQIVMRQIFFSLLQKKEIVLYEGYLPFDEFKPQPDESLPEFIKRGLAYFLAHDLIDIRIELEVAFYGDKRVLDDILILAEHGYGEDRYGNDIMLPEELGYLKR